MVLIHQHGDATCFAQLGCSTPVSRENNKAADSGGPYSSESLSYAQPKDIFHLSCAPLDYDVLLKSHIWVLNNKTGWPQTPLIFLDNISRSDRFPLKPTRENQKYSFQQMEVTRALIDVLVLFLVAPPGQFRWHLGAPARSGGPSRAGESYPLGHNSNFEPYMYIDNMYIYIIYIYVFPKAQKKEEHTAHTREF